MRFPELHAMFSGYLHPDWDLEASSLAEVAQHFAADAGSERASALLSEIDELMQPGKSDSSIRAALTKDFGYDPLWSDRRALDVIAEFRVGLTTQ